MRLRAHGIDQAGPAPLRDEWRFLADFAASSMTMTPACGETGTTGDSIRKQPFDHPTKELHPCVKR
jgi:hypothetical protein